MTNEVTKDAEEPATNGEAAVLESESTETAPEPNVPETVSGIAVSPEHTPDLAIEAVPAEVPLAELVSAPEPAAAPAPSCVAAAPRAAQAPRLRARSRVHIDRVRRHPRPRAAPCRAAIAAP